MSGEGDAALRVRRATPEDREAVIAFTEDTWPERGGDYIPRVYDSWMEAEGEDQRTLVIDAGEELAGVCQGVMLSAHEAWAQAMRVNPDYRGRGVSPELTYALFDWAAARGATVCRNMVFSWNTPGLGQSRSVGFDPCTEFRWATPDPDPDAAAETDREYRVSENPNAAWTCFRRSDASRHLRGLALDTGETWALSELTPAKLERAAERTAVMTLVDGDDRARAMTFRVRDYEREDEDGEPVRWAEYGVGVWSDLDAARGLFAAVARDAAGVDADRTRVLVPETAEHVTDAAYARAGVSEEPDFVLERDLTGR
jgi:GNAT superfamily N-acetyltransferase